MPKSQQVSATRIIITTPGPATIAVGTSLRQQKSVSGRIDIPILGVTIPVVDVSPVFATDEACESPEVAHFNVISILTHINESEVTQTSSDGEARTVTIVRDPKFEEHEYSKVIN